MKHSGSCHCGNIAFEVETEGKIEKVMECNCSMCARRGGLLFFVPASAFKLLTPREKVSTYLFNKRVIQHHFCSTCGISPYGEGMDKKGNTMVSVNARCIEGFDAKKAKVDFYDGLHV